jgi:KipI family sensor histidine kinase inhibitor
MRRPETGEVMQAVAKVVPRILASGDTALVVEFGTKADRALSELVLALDQRVREAGIVGVVEAVPTLRSLMIHHDPTVIDHDGLARALDPLIAGLEGGALAGRHWRLPACYEPALAADLASVAASTGLSADEVVARHSGAVYRVYALGFLPGLPYMGDLPAGLILPRRQSPRVAVPAGSIAIATTMTVIYPLESPGGWHLIGRTPVSLFDAGRAEPSLLAPADTVQFEPVDRAEYDRLLKAVAEGWRPAPVSAPGGACP